MGEEFGKKILNREFRRLSLEDVKTLAEKSQEDKNAIANALSANPKLSLQEAEAGIRREESDPAITPSEVGDEVGEPANTSSDDTEESIDPQKILAEFKKSQEHYREILCEIEEVEDTSSIPNMIKTEEAIIEKLKELQTPLAAGA